MALSIRSEDSTIVVHLNLTLLCLVHWLSKLFLLLNVIRSRLYINLESWPTEYACYSVQHRIPYGCITQVS